MRAIRLSRVMPALQTSASISPSSSSQRADERVRLLGDGDVGAERDGAPARRLDLGHDGGCAAPASER